MPCNITLVNELEINTEAVADLHVPVIYRVGDYVARRLVTVEFYRRVGVAVSRDYSYRFTTEVEVGGQRILRGGAAGLLRLGGSGALGVVRRIIGSFMPVIHSLTA